MGVVISGDQRDDEFASPRPPRRDFAQRGLAIGGAGVEKIAKHHQPPRRQRIDQRIEPAQVFARRPGGGGQPGGAERRRLADMHVGDEQCAARLAPDRALGQQGQVAPLERLHRAAARSSAAAMRSIRAR